MNINGTNSNDFLTDFMTGPPGSLVQSDTVFAFDGDDTVRIIAGNAWVDAGNGDDNVVTATGADTIFAGAGDDFIQSQNGSDRVYGGSGEDTLNGGLGSDLVDGGDDADLIIYTANGSDTLLGGSGDDDFRLVGIDSTDISNVQYDAGSDTYTFDVGVNHVTLSGGAGADEIIFDDVTVAIG